MTGIPYPLSGPQTVEEDITAVTIQRLREARSFRHSRRNTDTKLIVEMSPLLDRILRAELSMHRMSQGRILFRPIYKPAVSFWNER